MTCTTSLLEIPRLRVLVVGAGLAGRRFLDVLCHFSRTDAVPIRGIAVCDHDASRLTGLPPEIDVFCRTVQAVEQWRPNAIIVAVNESQHLEVYRQVVGEASVQAILSEKPLTGSGRESRQALDLLTGSNFSMNFVERFSPVLGRLAAWRAAHPDCVPVRVHARWGKNRINDPRPTIGVLSEIVHPLDLVDQLVGLDGAHIEHVRCLTSDYSVSGESVPETIDVLFRTPQCVISVSSSFAWSERVRALEIILRKSGREFFLATLRFDEPNWDCDKLTVSRFGPGDGRGELVECYESTNGDFPEELRQRYKVSEFVRAGLRGLTGGERDPRLPTLEQVAGIEGILENVRVRAAASGNSFAARIHHKDAQNPIVDGPGPAAVGIEGTLLCSRDVESRR